MSHSSWIEVSYVGANVSILEMIAMLLKNGWSLNDDGFINLLPVGDHDAFNWTRLSITEMDTAFEILRKKEESGEIVGITLTWPESGTGVNALFLKENTISFSLTIDRKTLEQNDFTDVSWYLSRIIPPLSANKILIENIAWSEHV